MDRFVIRAYGKQELAMLYFPNVKDPHVAVNRLTGWIKRCKALSHSLEAIGYNRFAKIFTPREVGLIVEYLGEP